MRAVNGKINNKRRAGKHGPKGRKSLRVGETEKMRKRM